MRQRKATPVQRTMLALMGVAFGALFLWAVPEVIGVISPAAEDTHSEWVWDQSGPVVFAIAGAHILAGVLFVWSGGHFIEGWRRRR